MKIISVKEQALVSGGGKIDADKPIVITIIGPDGKPRKEELLPGPDPIKPIEISEEY